MPRVLRIINRFNLGGPTYNVAYLSKYLPADYVTMLVGGEKDESEDSSLFIAKSLGLEPIVIAEMKRSLHPWHDYLAYRKIKKIIREFKPDIVHTHASKAGTLGRLAAKHCGVHVIIHTFHGHVFHSYFGKLSTFFYKTVERYLAKFTTKIVAISELQRTELSEIHRIAPASKFVVIPLGFDLKRFSEDLPRKRNQFRNNLGLNEDHLAVGIIGRLVPIKNHKMFIRGIQILRDAGFKNVKGIIVGDGELRQQLEAFTESLGLKIKKSGMSVDESDVLFTGWIKEADVALAGLDIVCLTSFNEGTPVSLIEAQAAGKPILSTRVGGVEDVVQEENTALLCRSDHPEEFAEKLICLASDPMLRKKLSGGGREFVLERFSYGRLVADMDSLYRHCLQNKAEPQDNKV